LGGGGWFPDGPWRSSSASSKAWT